MQSWYLQSSMLNFDCQCVESVNQIGKNWCLDSIESSCLWIGNIFYFISLVSFIRFSSFSHIYPIHIFKYFISRIPVLIMFLISVYIWLLLVYRKSVGFYKLSLYHESLLISLIISSRSFFCLFSSVDRCRVICELRQFYFFQICIPVFFFLFSYIG